MTSKNNSGTTPAPPGQTWVCLACGKKADTKYGFYEDGSRSTKQNWDESCMLNSELFDEQQLVHNLQGRVIQILPLVKIKEEP